MLHSDGLRLWGWMKLPLLAIYYRPSRDAEELFFPVCCVHQIRATSVVAFQTSFGSPNASTREPHTPFNAAERFISASPLCIKPFECRGNSRQVSRSARVCAAQVCIQTKRKGFFNKLFTALFLHIYYTHAYGEMWRERGYMCAHRQPVASSTHSPRQTISFFFFFCCCCSTIQCSCVCNKGLLHPSIWLLLCCRKKNNAQLGFYMRLAPFQRHDGAGKQPVTKGNGKDNKHFFFFNSGRSRGKMCAALLGPCYTTYTVYNGPQQIMKQHRLQWYVIAIVISQHSGLLFLKH